MSDEMLRAPAAPGIDPTGVRELLIRRIAQWKSHIPADSDAQGTRAIRTHAHPGMEGETDYNNDVALYREGIAVMQEALTMIDASPKGGTCGTCNGHGMIGGLLPAGGGYESEPCPDCSPKGGSDECWACFCLQEAEQNDEVICDSCAMQATSAEVKP